MFCFLADEHTLDRDELPLPDSDEPWEGGGGGGGGRVGGGGESNDPDVRGGYSWPYPSSSDTQRNGGQMVTKTKHITPRGMM